MERSSIRCCGLGLDCRHFVGYRCDYVQRQTCGEVRSHVLIVTHADDESRVPVNPLALNPTKGGKKNLPIASFLYDDEESDVQKELLKKPKLVIIGGGEQIFTNDRHTADDPNIGWGSIAALKNLDLNCYHVTIVSRTYTESMTSERANGHLKLTTTTSSRRSCRAHVLARSKFAH